MTKKKDAKLPKQEMKHLQRDAKQLKRVTMWLQRNIEKQIDRYKTRCKMTKRTTGGRWRLLAPLQDGWGAFLRISCCIVSCSQETCFFLKIDPN